MNEPKVRIGFIVINPNYQCEIQRDNKGHWHTAKIWIQNNGFEKIFEEVRDNPENNIHDFDDFLTDYLGAIKLYATGGKKKCYIPRMVINKEYKSFLKRFYRNHGYEICGDVSNEDIHEIPIFNTVYYKTVVMGSNGEYIYNPLRIGD